LHQNQRDEEDCSDEGEGIVVDEDESPRNGVHQARPIVKKIQKNWDS
jgi:hypothetical protein